MLSDALRSLAKTLLCALALTGIVFWVYVAYAAWTDGIYGLFSMSLIILLVFALIALEEGGDG